LHAVTTLPRDSEATPLPPFTPDHLWLGAMVPKRWARRAVTRNSIRRQIYSVSSQFEPALRQGAYVVRLRSAFDKAQFVSADSQKLRLAVRDELHQLFGSFRYQAP